MNILQFADTELQVVHAALMNFATKDALPILNSIDQQLRAAAAKADQEALALKAAAEAEAKTLKAKLEAFEASAKAGIVHVIDEVKAAL